MFGIQKKLAFVWISSNTSLNSYVSRTMGAEMSIRGIRGGESPESAGVDTSRLPSQLIGIFQAQKGSSCAETVVSTSKRKDRDYKEEDIYTFGSVELRMGKLRYEHVPALRKPQGQTSIVIPKSSTARQLRIQQRSNSS